MIRRITLAVIAVIAAAVAIAVATRSVDLETSTIEDGDNRWFLVAGCAALFLMCVAAIVSLMAAARKESATASVLDAVREIETTVPATRTADRKELLRSRVDRAPSPQRPQAPTGEPSADRPVQSPSERLALGRDRQPGKADAQPDSEPASVPWSIFSDRGVPAFPSAGGDQGSPARRSLTSVPAPSDADPEPDPEDRPPSSSEPSDSSDPAQPPAEAATVAAPRQEQSAPPPNATDDSDQDPLADLLDPDSAEGPAGFDPDDFDQRSDTDPADAASPVPTAAPVDNDRPTEPDADPADAVPADPVPADPVPADAVPADAEPDPVPAAVEPGLLRWLLFAPHDAVLPQPEVPTWQRASEPDDPPDRGHLYATGG